MATENKDPELCKSHPDMPLEHTFESDPKNSYCDDCLRAMAFLEQEKPGSLAKRFSEKDIELFYAKLKDMKPQRLVCPYCDQKIKSVEFRPFGPGGIMTMVGCPTCLRPLGLFVLPAEPASPGAGGKSSIITP